MEFITERFKHTVLSSQDDGGKTANDDEKFKLSLAFQNLSEIDSSKNLPERTDNIRILDLTENSLTGTASNLRFLYEFPNLRTLILDKNQVQSNFVLPPMPSLTTLWVNHNKIENLAIFIENVANSCPNLTYLSMINNKASPSYFNQGTLVEYNDYRYYVISKLRSLSMLDDKVISAEERSQSQAIYGVGRVVKRNRDSGSIKNNRKSLVKSGRSDSLRSSEPSGAAEPRVSSRISSVATAEPVSRTSKQPSELEGSKVETKEAKRRSSVKTEKRSSKISSDEESVKSPPPPAPPLNDNEELPDLPDVQVSTDEPNATNPGDLTLDDLPDLPDTVEETDQEQAIAEQERSLEMLPDIIEETNDTPANDQVEAGSLEENLPDDLPTIDETNESVTDSTNPAEPTLVPSELESLPDVNEPDQQHLMRPSFLLQKSKRANLPPPPTP